MPTQLRLYTINRGSLQQFADEWKRHVYPLRLQHGFQIERAWLMEQTNQFVWLLSYDGPETWEAKETAYYESSARLALEPNPARLIARAEEYFLRDLD